MNRGNYNEITYASQPDWVRRLVVEAEKAGVFRTGIVSDRKQRGVSVNVDVYGFDESKGLAVIQVRQCVFHPRRFNQVRKDYYLIGHTESGNVFAHPVESPVRSKTAMSSPETCIAYVEAKIWGCEIEDLAEIVRQGDVAFVPARLPENAMLIDQKEIVIRDTHKVTAERIYKTPDGQFFTARRAKAVHAKRQHEPVRVKGGFYRIVAGYRARVWGFTRPLGD